jgi:hypothetical protein
MAVKLAYTHVHLHGGPAPAPRCDRCLILPTFATILPNYDASEASNPSYQLIHATPAGLFTDF